MKNILTAIATPIGNLNDVSNNTINNLNQLDYLFCEDTRTTLNLLQKLNLENIKKIKLISYHKFNEKEKLNEAIELIKNYSCGLVSDAGYPSINDPGLILINECHKQKIKINVIDGPCSIIHAIVQSGFCDNGFIFNGFLKRTPNEIIEQINALIDKNLPLVFLESIHRINKTIEVLKNYYPDFMIYIGRELTKLHEEYVINEIKNINPINEKGEVVVIIKPIKFNNLIDLDLDQKLEKLLSFNMKLKDACKYLASEYNLSSNDLYNKYISKNKN